MTNIEKLRASAERLLALLSDHHPGLLTWRQALAREIAQISEFAEPDEAAE